MLLLLYENINGKRVPFERGLWAQRQRYIFERLSFVVEQQASLQIEIRLACDFLNGKRLQRPVGVEENLVIAHRTREVHRSARLKHVRQVRDADGRSVRIERVTVSTEAKMLDGVQARQGVGNFGVQSIGIHHVRLLECHARNERLQSPDVKNFEVPKTRYVRDEPIEPRTYIDVALGCGLVNHSGDKQVLPEIFRANRPCLLPPVMQAGLEAQFVGALAYKESEVSHIAN